MGTALWVVFCVVALVAVVGYLVVYRPPRWFGRDERDNYPYILGDADGDDPDAPP